MGTQNLPFKSVYYLNTLDNFSYVTKTNSLYCKACNLFRQVRGQLLVQSPSCDLIKPMLAHPSVKG